MKLIQSQELKEIRGGVTLSGTLLNSITNLLKILLEAGRALGSSFRRLEDDQICSLR